MRIRSHLLLIQVASLGVISLGASCGWLLSHQLERQARRLHGQLELQGSQAAHVAFDLLKSLPSLAPYPHLGQDQLTSRISGDVDALRQLREHLDEHLSTLPLHTADRQLRQELQEIRLDSIQLESNLIRALGQVRSNPDPAARSRTVEALMRDQAMLDMRHHGEELALVYDRIEAETKQAQRGQDRAISSGIAISVLMLLVGWLVGLAVARRSSQSMLRPLLELGNLMQEPPADLEDRLQSRLFQSAPEEIANLSRGFLNLHQRVGSLLETLERQARTDSLTQVGNRRLFEEALQNEWARATRSGEPLSLLMLDVDHFKAYNDHYGHPEGDTCLRQIAGTIQAQARRCADQVCRIGGEEFAVLLPATSSAQAQDLAQRILSGIDGLAIPHAAADGPGWVTVSIGLASAQPSSPSANAAALMKRADAALYRRKQELGRHGLCAATEAS